MGRAAAGCQGDCGAARPLLNGAMAKGGGKQDPEREQRLAEALRANLRRRKEQARAAKDQSEEKP
jgi:hypothetical protein